jgi:hypothetical protein
LFPLAIFYLGMLLEAAILWRAVLQKIWRQYPFFYSYIAASLVSSAPVCILYLANSPSYWQWYWIAQLATLLLGCGIVLEVFNNILAPYPGATRFARLVILIGFAVIICFAAIYSLLSLRWSPSGTEFQLERDLRTLQAIFLGAIAILICYYRIELGRNMRGMLRGYILYVSASLVSFALRSFAGRSFNVWMFIPPLSYDVCLAIWLAALWSYHANPLPDPAIHLEADYETFVAATKTAMGSVRSQLARAVRP